MVVWFVKWMANSRSLNHIFWQYIIRLCELKCEWKNWRIIDYFRPLFLFSKGSVKRLPGRFFHWTFLWLPKESNVTHHMKSKIYWTFWWLDKKYWWRRRDLKWFLFCLVVEYVGRFHTNVIQSVIAERLRTSQHPLLDLYNITRILSNNFSLSPSFSRYSCIPTFVFSAFVLLLFFFTVWDSFCIALELDILNSQAENLLQSKHSFLITKIHYHKETFLHIFYWKYAPSNFKTHYYKWIAL
jgi:hypothetical protein